MGSRHIREREPICGSTIKRTKARRQYRVQQGFLGYRNKSSGVLNRQRVARALFCRGYTWPETDRKKPRQATTWLRSVLSIVECPLLAESGHPGPSAFDPAQTEAVEHAQPEVFSALDQPVITAPIPSKLQQKCLLVPAVRDAPELAGDEMAVGAGQRSTPYSFAFPPDSASLGLSADLIQA